MEITITEARTLDALARNTTFAGAAKALGKRHTAVVYALRSLEEKTGLGLLDRRGYRTRLTAAGERVLEACRRLLDEERAIVELCAELRGGWEPSLKIVVDGIYPIDGLLDSVSALAQEQAPTRIGVLSEFLGAVEETFVSDEADLMISVVPPRALRLRASRLVPITLSLVCHRKHPLASRRKQPLTANDLAEHVLVTVRGSDPRLELSTQSIDNLSTIHLSDFAAKKAAIMRGIGYGWLPDHLARREIERGALKRVRWIGTSVHDLVPFAYSRPERPLGRAGRKLLQALGAAGPFGEGANL